jgi:hypothetical protein
VCERERERGGGEVTYILRVCAVSASGDFLLSYRVVFTDFSVCDFIDRCRDSIQNIFNTKLGSLVIFTHTFPKICTVIDTEP